MALRYWKANYVFEKGQTPFFETIPSFSAQNMDNRLLKILEEETAKEKAAKKKKPFFKVRKEKSIMYYSGWHRGKPIGKKSKEEKQTRLQQ